MLPPPWANRQIDTNPHSDAWTIDGSEDLNGPSPGGNPGPAATPGTTFLAANGKYYSEVNQPKNT